MTVPSPLMAAMQRSIDATADLLPKSAPKKRPLRDEDGGLIIISPSQHEKLDATRGCDQAWAYRYIAGVKTPDKPSALFGTDTHDLLDRYYKHNEIPPQTRHAGEVAVRMLKRLPMRHPSLLPEYEFQVTLFVLADVGEVRERGKIDVFDPTRLCGFLVGRYSKDKEDWPAFDGFGRPYPLVIDHKTTSNFDYVKTADVLAGVFDANGVCLSKPDPQASIYGFEALRDHYVRYGVLPEYVHFRWNFAHTSKAKEEIRTVDLRLTAQEIMRNVASLRADNLHALELAESSTDLHAFRKNTRACPAFGGCGYGPGTTKTPGLNMCQITSGERFRSLMQGNPTPASLATAAQALFGAAPQAAPAGNPFAQQAAPAGNPFAQQQAAPAGNPFAQQAAPALVQAPQANPFGQQASPFGANPFAPQAAPAPVAAPAGNPFAPQAAPVAAPLVNTFAQAAVNPQQTLAVAPQGNPFAPQAPVVVAPPQVQIPANIPPEQRDAWIAHCAQNNLDVATGAPLTAPAQQQAAPVGEPAKRKRRTKAEIAAAKAAGQAVDPNEESDDEGPSILITSKALNELIGFLQSLAK